MTKTNIYYIYILSVIISHLPLKSVCADKIRAKLSVDLPVLTLSGAILGGIHLGKATSHTQLHTRSFAPESSLDKLAPITLNSNAKLASDYLLYTALGVGVGTQLYVGRAHWLDHLIVCLEVNAVNGLLTEFTKYSIRRPRPLTRTQGVQKIDDELSFFSGHTSFVAALTFSTAQVMVITQNLSFKQKFSLYSAAFLMSTATGILRVQAGKHYPTDVIVGALVGASVGILIPELHRQRKVGLTTQHTEQGHFLALYTHW